MSDWIIIETDEIYSDILVNCSDTDSDSDSDSGPLSIPPTPYPIISIQLMNEIRNFDKNKLRKYPMYLNVYWIIAAGILRKYYK